MIIEKRKKHLYAALDLFTKAELESELRPKVVELLKRYPIWEEEELDLSDYTNLLTKRSRNKQELIELVAIPFITKKIYRKWLTLLTDDARIIWDALIFEKYFHEADIKQKWDIILTKNKDRYWYGNLMDRLTPGLRLFQTKRAGSWNNPSIVISLPYELRILLKDFYDPPKEAHLNILTECPTTEFRYENGERTILSELSRIYLYHDQGQIPLTGKNRPKITSLGKMRKTLHLREFFGADEKDKKLNILRTNMMASLIVRAGLQRGSDWLAFLKKQLLGQAILNKVDTPAVLLNDLKGMGHIDSHYLAGIEPYYYRFFQALPDEGWIDFEELYHSARFNLLPMEPIVEWVAKDKLYLEFEDMVQIGAHQFRETKHFIDERRYHKAIGIPYFTASIFMYAAIGAFDIAYDRPDRTKVGKTSYSAYDGLRYLRITPLGAYLFGKTDHYDMAEVEEESNLTFSPDALTITAAGEEAALSFLLKPYTRQLGPNRFATDSQTFLQGIHSKVELEQKIRMFRDVAGSKFPSNWEAFFTGLRKKVDPFVPLEEQMILYKLPEDNRPLIQLIAQDAMLKKMVLKAEGYHILLPKSKLPAFRKRLAEFGYLVT